MQNWERAVNGEPISKIQPLKVMNKVISARANDDFTLDLRFSDGSLRRFDTNPYLDKGIFTDLKDLDYFRAAAVAYGTVQWKNEQDFAPETLYIESELLN